MGPLQGGKATNVVPDLASAWGNVRFADEAGAQELAARLESLQTATDALPRVEAGWDFNRPAKPMTAGTERLARLARAAAESLGQNLPFARTGGVCDGNQLQAAGLPTIDTLGVRGAAFTRPRNGSMYPAWWSGASSSRCCWRGLRAGRGRATDSCPRVGMVPADQKGVCMTQTAIRN